MMPPVNHQTFPLVGGLDQVTPTNSLKPGVARAALNWEVSINGGASVITGYERFDGRVGEPSLATFSAFTLDNADTLAVGDALSNGTGATGTVIAIASTVVYYTQQVGAFAVADVVNGGPVITALGGPRLTSRQRANYRFAAGNVYRALIAKVPGSGAVRGVCRYRGTVYAWRDNAGESLLELYKSTTAGWVKVVFGYEVAFVSGNGAIPAVASSITKGVVSAVVRRVVTESGSWGAGTAAGRFIVDAPTGGSFTAGALTAGATATLTTGLSGGLVQAVIAFLPGGRVQTVVDTFGNGAAERIYGCDGVNRGFEFDGTTMVPIETGMATDVPTHLAVHKNYLFFAFGSSVQFSGLNDQYAFSPILGAGEFVVDGDVTGLLVLTGNQTTGAMAIFTEGSSYILYGSTFGSGGDGKLVPLNSGIGAEPYTAQNMDQAYALSSRGVSALSQTLNYGNFDSSTLTLTLRRFIQTHRGTATASGLNREKSQYRVFYSSGDALYLTINNGKYLGGFPVTFPDVVTCWCDGPNDAGVESSFIGTDSGYVMQMERGTSFDGEPIPFLLQLNWNAMGDPRVIKRWRKAALEIQTPNQAEFNVGFSLEFGDTTQIDQYGYVAGMVPFLPSITYDAGYTYDSGLYYDGHDLGPVEVDLGGSGVNLALLLRGSTAIYEPFTINSVTIHYTPRRGVR